MPRLNVNVNDETARALRAMAEEESTSVTEVVRRAVSVYKFFDDAREHGKSVQLVDRENNVTSVEFV